MALTGTVGLLGIASGVSAISPSSLVQAAPAASSRSGLSPAVHRAVIRTVADVTTVPKVPTYAFTTVRFGSSIDAQISGINVEGTATGNIVQAHAYKTFILRSTKGAKPLYFTIPYKAIASTVATAGIDTAGDVVGSYAGTNGVYHGFERTHKGLFKSINIPGAGTVRGEGTEIAGISPNGVIVGSYVTSKKAATGFIDSFGRLRRYAEKSAGKGVGEGTAVEFYDNGEFGGIFIGPGKAGHGWYVLDGKLHTVDDPAAGKYAAGHGTQLVGVDKHGRLYGIVTPARGTIEGFSVLGTKFSSIEAPYQFKGKNGATLVLSANSDGVIAGFFVYNEAGNTRAFEGRPKI